MTSTSLVAKPAAAGDVAARLDYAARATCPTGADLEAVVARHLGYSPFREHAPHRVVIRIDELPHTLEGHLEWRDEAGVVAGMRSFPSRSKDCNELVGAMGFALSVQFQLLAVPVPPSDPSAPTPTTGGEPARTAEMIVPGRPPAAAPPPPPPPVVGASALLPGAPSSGPRVAVGAGAVAGFGPAPEVAGLGRVFGSVAWPRVAVELAAEVSIPRTLYRDDGGGVRHQFLLAELAGCGLTGRWSACALLKGGQLRVGGEGVTAPATSSGLLLAGGLRVALTQTLGPRWYVVAHGDVVALITRDVVTLDKRPVWTTGRVAGAVGLAVGVRFR